MACEEEQLLVNNLTIAKQQSAQDLANAVAALLPLLANQTAKQNAANLADAELMVANFAAQQQTSIVDNKTQIDADTGVALQQAQAALDACQMGGEQAPIT